MRKRQNKQLNNLQKLSVTGGVVRVSDRLLGQLEEAEKLVSIEVA